MLASTNPAQKPLFTLDASKIIQGLHTSTIPDGYANTIQILASGKIPGVLLPGESITVPVYYAGLQQPWDFSRNERAAEPRSGRHDRHVASGLEQSQEQSTAA